jgi:hypothetical protein
LKGDDLPLAMVFGEDEGRAGVYFARVALVLEFEVGGGENNGDVGPHEADALKRELGAAAFVDGVEDVLM